MVEQVEKISKTTTITIGLVISILGVVFYGGASYQRLNNLEGDNILTQEMLRETREIAKDNKSRLDFMDRMGTPRR